MSSSETPAPSAANIASAGDALTAAQERNEALQARLDALDELLARSLADILAERDRFKEAAVAWDAFGAQWMLSQRAMKRVALDLGQAQGVSEHEVVARAMSHANAVLNGDGVDLGGTVAQAQLDHIARHRPLLRKQFRQP